MHGQANHFMRYAPVKLDYAITRFSNEARRLVAVLESRLNVAEYLAAEYSIADIACWPFIAVVEIIGINLEEFPSVLRWTQAIRARPAVQRVSRGEKTAIPAVVLQSNRKLTEEQWSNVFGERLWNAVRSQNLSRAG
jgi:GST-like protein